MKMLIGFLGTALLAVSFIAAANCECQKSACSQEKGCSCCEGCAMGKKCNCPPGCGCK